MGGKENCCADNRTKLNVRAADPQSAEPPTSAEKAYLNDICKTTAKSNGNLIVPTSPTNIHDDTATLTNTAMDSHTANDSVSNMSSRASMMGDSAAVSLSGLSNLPPA